MELSQNYASYHFILEPDDFLALKNETRCAICLDIFDDPVTTFCQHTYCRKCLEGHIKSNGTKQASCPLCKMPVGKRNYIADKKATILAQIILNIKPVKKLVINETPKRELLSTRKRRASDLVPVNKLYEVSKQHFKEKGSETKRRLVDEDDDNEYPTKIVDSPKQKSSKQMKPITKRKTQKINFLVSNMPEEYQHEVDKFCQLYKAKEYKEYRDDLTHLVVFPIEQKNDKIIAKRTLKYLSALVNGIWVVAFNWIIHSNGYEELKDEEEFEVLGDPYGLNTPRDSRLKEGMRDLLENLRFYVSDKQSRKDGHISKKEFMGLIESAGGEIIESTKGKTEVKDFFHVVITPSGSVNNEKESTKSARSCQSTDGIIISHKWILDSISKGKLLNYKNYI